MTDPEPDDAEEGIGELERFLNNSPVLDRVVEVNQTVEAQGGGRVVVTSVELWTSLIVVQATIVGSDQSRRLPRSDADVAERQRRFDFTRFLGDDLGNTYDTVGGGGGGGGDAAMMVEHYTYSFRGPVDPAASTLFYRPIGSATDCELQIRIA